MRSTGSWQDLLERVAHMADRQAPWVHKLVGGSLVRRFHEDHTSSFLHLHCKDPCVCVLLTGAYTNLVKLQMQQHHEEEVVEEELEEVIAADGRPLTRNSMERSREAAARKSLEGGLSKRKSLEEVLKDEAIALAR